MVKRKKGGDTTTTTVHIPGLSVRSHLPGAKNANRWHVPVVIGTAVFDDLITIIINITKGGSVYVQNTYVLRSGYIGILAF